MKNTNLVLANDVHGALDLLVAHEVAQVVHEQLELILVNGA